MIAGPARSIATVLGFLALGVASCASPTLPLPPPDEPVVSPSTQAGRIHLHSSGGAEPNAVIVIVNEDVSVPLESRVTGSEADATGTWDADVVATSGDVLDINEEYGSSRSPSIEVSVP